MMFLLDSEKKFKEFWTRKHPMLNLILFFYRKEVKEMAVVYATLIVKGKKTFAQVPDRIKEQVKQVLIDLDCGDLAE
jgi:hypothetical protein